jgi:hypothetical protein
MIDNKINAATLSFTLKRGGQGRAWFECWNLNIVCNLVLGIFELTKGDVCD